MPEKKQQMHANDSGHSYSLHNFEGDESQQILFIKKEKNEAGEFQTVQNGTTNEALLQVLIHRISMLNTLMPSAHNIHALSYVQLALEELEARTQDRINRNVEGTPKI